MKAFSATYPDVVKFDKKPNEDFYLVSKKLPIFVVADGVTRPHFEDGRYANHSGARKAAEIFCKSALSYLEERFDAEKMKEAFDFANQKIKELNVEAGMDKKLNYIEYDWLDTVGVAGIILHDRLYYGYVGDCGLVIFDKDNKKKFQTEDMVSPAVERFKETYKNWENLTSNQKRLVIHKELRNSPDKKGYGTFTGEKGVENYYNIGSEKLEEGDLAVFYSDGFLEYIENKHFIDILRRGDRKELNKAMFWKVIRNPIKCGHDRTFIAINFDKK